MKPILPVLLYYQKVWKQSKKTPFDDKLVESWVTNPNQIQIEVKEKIENYLQTKGYKV